MSKQSLILQNNPRMNRIEIIDIHRDILLKHISCNTPLVFNRLDILTRSGKVSFDFLLSDAVRSLSDIPELNQAPTPEQAAFLKNTNDLLDALQDFEIGDEVMFKDKKYIIHLFNLQDKPITANIARGHTVKTVELSALEYLGLPEGPFFEIMDSVYYPKDTKNPYKITKIDKSITHLEDESGNTELALLKELTHAAPQFSRHYQRTTASPADNEASRSSNPPNIKNQREIYEALLAGETLISDRGGRAKLDGGVLYDDSGNMAFHSFTYPEDWRIYKEPKWEENISTGGVLCWNNKTVCIVYNKASMGNFAHTYTPLTKQEIQIFKDNAPEDL